jgi:tetratricopeptide (TPR) repeat protein
MRVPALGSFVISLLLITAVVAQHELHPNEPLTQPDPALRKPLLLIRQGKTIEARQELTTLLKTRPGDAEVLYQIARTYLSEFYGNTDPSRGRVALGLAMETLESVLRKDLEHIPALKAKAVIHARAELLYYNPNLAYSLAARVAKLQPSANEYLLTLTDWLSGEVRFTVESGHRVPHDPLLGLDRSIELLDSVLDSTVPYGNEESLALYQMGRTLSKRGHFKESVEYLQLALARPASAAGRPEILRELGISYYRMGDFAEASRTFYRALTLRNNSIDQWLLKVAMDRWEGGGIQLPPQLKFPVHEVTADPANPPLLSFADMAKELGVNRFDGNGTCAFGDFTGDGRPDLVLAGSGTFLAAYRNDGSRFQDVTAEVGLAKVQSSYSVNMVDYDNDGRLDLYLSLNGWNGPMADRLLRNAGGKFEDVSQKSGAADPGSGFVSLWGDLDNDGLLDLVVANGVLKDGSVPQLYRNKGDGTFENRTAQSGINEPPTHGTIGSALGDYDRDGDLDVFFNGLQNSPNRLYRNDGAFRFTDVTRQSGVGQQPPHNGFVAFFVDYNNDTYPDLLVTSLAPWDAVVEGFKSGYSLQSAAAVHNDAVRLFRNNRNGTFTDVTFAAGLYRPMGVMGAGVADLDNDGWVDFYFGTGDPQLSRLEPNRFFRNNGDGTFADLTTQIGLARPGNKGHGACFIDVDDDGDLDFYQQLGGHYPGDHAENAFYRNQKGNQNHWLQIELTGVKSNRFAVGAAITVKAGGQTYFREVKGSEGFGSTSPYRQHFGLGKLAAVESVEVVWPSGTKQTFTGIEPDHLYTIREDAERTVLVR